ncbi:hypothetical protein HYW76_01895 [Candidatus Pacearchaeota archaeon]|nr:hypothetical protein [Candidatus Pacearchaeota archaeon]
MDKEFERLWWLFILEVIFIVFVYLSGGKEFVEGNNTNSIMFSIGILTFISIFYAFISEKGEMLHQIFSDYIKELENKHWSSAEEYIHKKDKEKVEEEVYQTDRLKMFLSNVRPNKWLFLSTFSLVLSIGLFMTKINASFPLIKINTFSVASILFYMGFLFTLFLLNSILILLISQYKNKNNPKEDIK